MCSKLKEKIDLVVRQSVEIAVGAKHHFCNKMKQLWCLDNVLAHEQLQIVWTWDTPARSASVLLLVTTETVPLAGWLKIPHPPAKKKTTTQNYGHPTSSYPIVSVTSWTHTAGSPILRGQGSWSWSWSKYSSSRYVYIEIENWPESQWHGGAVSVTRWRSG